MHLPRVAGAIVVVVGGSSFYLLLPWLLSIPVEKFGWSSNSPSLWNWFGMIPIIAGATLIVWAISLHFSHAPSGWKFTAKPQYLLTTGPYRHTRNPMYLGGITVWLGWTIYYGSLTVLGALILFTGFVMLVLVPWEERLLEKHFGEEYRQYKNTVRRWLPDFS